ncbi:MAG: FAD-dependent monooxygenase, partial [Microbacterium sp.]|nr:FAD-dependent monooxygenase [Microbacterium sp.]
PGTAIDVLATLARYDVPLRIVDKAATRTDKSKALIVWSRTLELLARADLAASFVSAGLQMRGANIFAGKERLARLDFESVASPFRFALGLPQSETERLLEERLRALGATRIYFQLLDIRDLDQLAYLGTEVLPGLPR